MSDRVLSMVMAIVTNIHVESQQCLVMFSASLIPLDATPTHYAIKTDLDAFVFNGCVNIEYVHPRGESKL